MVRSISLDRERAARLRAAGYWDGATSFRHLEAAAERHAARAAIVDRCGELTYGELFALVERASWALADLGVGIGDVVSWQLPNWREGTILHLAAVRLGAISNPIVPIYREREVAFVLDKAESAVLVVPDEFRSFGYAAMARTVVAATRPSCVVVTVGDSADGDVSWDELLKREVPRVPPADQLGERVSLLQFTSGTTADAKGVLHTNDTMSWEARSFSRVFGAGDGDVVLAVSPIGHMAGLLTGVFVPVLNAIPSIYLDRWEPDAAVELIARYRCSVAAGAAPFLSGIVNSSRREALDTSCFRFFCVGGSDVPPALVRAADEIGVVAARSYGSTECPVISAGTVNDPIDVRADTDGVLQPGVRLRIVRDDGTEAASGEQGELVVDAPMRMLGYLDPAHEDGVVDDDGFFRTGDQGVVEDGRLRVTGRIKDIIIRGGENISAKEVEDVLHENPLVSEAAVVGAPDAVLGEKVVAFVVPVGDELDPESVIAGVERAGLARQKIPVEVFVVAELPHTASGKVQKFKLRTRLRGRIS